MGVPQEDNDKASPMGAAIRLTFRLTFLSISETISRTVDSLILSIDGHGDDRRVVAIFEVDSFFVLLLVVVRKFDSPIKLRTPRSVSSVY